MKNFTEITRADLHRGPCGAIAFDNCGINGGIHEGRVWLAVQFNPESKREVPVTLEGTPTQWLELASALYGLAGRLLELQQDENRRREAGLDLLPGGA